MALLSKKNLIQRIKKGRDARRRLVASNLAKGVAFQIRSTRDARGMTQGELANLAGMSQNNLCRLEDPQYGKQTLSSLKRIADALDVALVVRFVPFSRYVDWLTGTPSLDPGLTPEALTIPSFSDEESTGVFSTSVGALDRQWVTSQPPLLVTAGNNYQTPMAFSRPTPMDQQVPVEWQPYMHQKEFYGQQTRA